MLRNITSIILVWALSAANAAAQTASGEFRTSGAYHENFFQAPDDGPRRNVWVASTEIRIEDPLADDNRLRAYTSIEFLQARDIGSSPAALIGVRRRGRTHRFDTYVTMLWNRPRSDVGDELEKADQLGGGAKYAYRIAGLELASQADYREEFLKPQRITASRSYEGGGSIAYRAFSGRVVPEIGFLQGRRITGNARNEYVQDTAYVELRMSAVPHIALDARYRLRRRDYTVQDVTAKNFAREDRREQVRANLDISFEGPLVWNFFGTVEEGRSTRPGRAFVAKSFGAGFTLRY
jgi:hypothetical protein